MQHGFPLHRMNVISYGLTKPVADNHTKDGRAKNRRVALVVLM
jgi:outer membrane protein OmpA-like peptidoglycan-associated protein